MISWGIPLGKDCCRKQLFGNSKDLKEGVGKVKENERLRFEHVTPLLVQLHWLPVSYRTVFKLLLLVYKSVNGLCPSYVADLLKIRSSSRSLRSSSMDYLVQPVSKTKTYGDRAFSVRAPKLWNSIPFSIRNYKSSSVTIFKKNVKTFLFSKFVTSNSLLFN